jgi:hypothetical protein
MDDVAATLIEAMVDAYGPYVSARLSELGIEISSEWENALAEAQAWLRSELVAVLSQRFDRQRRGPLEVFQEALAGPTEKLLAAGVAPVQRDAVVRTALPGDIFGLAPASSQALGEGAWRAHLRWGAAKAAWIQANGAER